MKCCIGSMRPYPMIYGYLIFVVRTKTLPPKFNGIMYNIDTWYHRFISIHEISWIPPWPRLLYLALPSTPPPLYWNDNHRWRTITTTIIQQRIRILIQWPPNTLRIPTKIRSYHPPIPVHKHSHLHSGILLRRRCDRYMMLLPIIVVHSNNVKYYKVQWNNMWGHIPFIILPNVVPPKKHDPHDILWISSSKNLWLWKPPSPERTKHIKWNGFRSMWLDSHSYWIKYGKWYGLRLKSHVERYPPPHWMWHCNEIHLPPLRRRSPYTLVWHRHRDYF